MMWLKHSIGFLLNLIESGCEDAEYDRMSIVAKIMSMT
jgi:hypothetical protein